MHLLQQMGPATGGQAHIPDQPPSTPTREAALLAAHINVNVRAVAAAAATVRAQQVADFTTAAGSKALVAAIAVGAMEEQEAAQVAQTATRATLATDKAAIAEAEATTATT